MRQALCLALLLLPQAVSPTSISAQEVSKEVLKHIRAVSVSIEFDGRTRGSGTIFHHQGETYCLTANHVVEAAKSKPHSHPLRVSQHHPGKVISVYAEVRSFCEDSDYAVLKLGKGVFLEGARVSCKKHGLDTPVVHCGSMQGFEHTITRGYINGLGRDTGAGTGRKSKRDQLDLTADHGSSGGGVFTTEGEFIGFVTEGYPQRIVFFVPIHSINLKEAIK